MRGVLVLLLAFALFGCDSASGTDAGAPVDAIEGLSSCDPRPVTCRAAEPVCPPYYAASVEAECWGPCVPNIDCRRPILCDEPSMTRQCPIDWGCAAGECAPPR
jgi:hypothetical protein